MYLLRVSLPDRPGSLGAVASALGQVGADIDAVDVVERAAGVVVDDFMLSVPGEVRPDTLITACTGLDGVEVLWVSFYPKHWNLQADVDLLEEMLATPAEAERTLAEAAPSVFHCSWAAVVRTDTGEPLYRTSMAPPAEIDATVCGVLDVARTCSMDNNWIPGWGAAELAIVPLRDGTSLVVGRPGPEFRSSELARLRHLALLAVDSGPAR